MNAFDKSNRDEDVAPAQPVQTEATDEYKPPVKAIQSMFGGAATPIRRSGVGAMKHALEQKQRETRMANDHRAHQRSHWMVNAPLSAKSVAEASTAPIEPTAPHIHRPPPARHGQYKKTVVDARGVAPKKRLEDLP